MIAVAVVPPKQTSLKERLAELVQTVSASRLNCWQQCRLKFWFRYVLRLPKPSPVTFFVGSMVHLILQAWNLARWRTRAVDLALLKETFLLRWEQDQAQKPLNWKGKEDAERSCAWGLLEMYFQQTPVKLDEKPEGVEVPVEADLANHGLPTIVGVIDLVRAGGRIVDFKTSAQTPTSEKVLHLHETQTSCYSVMYREATGKREGGIELHHLVKLKKPKLVVTECSPMSDSQQTRLFKVMESYVSGLQRQDIVPSPGMHCQSCEFFNECRAWH